MASLAYANNGRFLPLSRITPASNLLCVFLHFTLLSFSLVTCSTIEDMNSVELKSATQKHSRMVVYFYTDDCTECERQLSELEKIATALDDSVLEGMSVVKVKSVQTAAKYGVSKFPSLVYFRSSYPMLYGGDAVTAEDVFPWLERNVEVVTRELTDEDFEHLTQAATGATTGDWFVAFYKPSCDTVLSALESLGGHLKHKMNAARVDITQNPELVKRFNIKDCPTLILFHLGKMYRYIVPQKDLNSLQAFAEGWYKNVKGEVVLPPPSPFEELVSFIVEKLKTHIREPSFNVIMTVCMLAGVLFMLWFYYYCKGRSWEKKRD